VGLLRGSQVRLRRRPHKPVMRGFESRPRYDSKLGRQSRWHVVQRQDASPLRRSWEFESLRASNCSMRQPVIPLEAMVVWSRWLARHPVTVEIAGSSPVTTAASRHTRVAQWQERHPDAMEAAGSFPAAGTKLLW
jgi:hypothetical protein